MREMPEKPSIVAKVVTRPEELMQVFAVRSAVYLAEQDCPYEEEFDGNDYTATHILALVDGDPAACARIRWFANVAKGERVAVLPRYRRTGVTGRLVDKSFEICRRKGYRRVLIHAQRRLINHWLEYGFKPKSNEIFRFSGYEYVTMVRDLEADENAITEDADPMVLNRPEGDFDRPGVLERSAGGTLAA